MTTNNKATTKDMVNLLNEDYKETMNNGYKRSNRFTGESIQLTKEEAEKHDKIISIRERYTFNITTYKSLCLFK